MGFFDATIRDARRPLPGGWVRRSAADGPAPTPDDEADFDPGPSSGMETVFRFQKAESPAMPGGLREASYRPGTGESRLPAGDPLSAGGEVERPMPTATNVEGNQSISVKGDSGGSELETGQVERGSPGDATAANAVSGSRSFRADVSFGPFEPGYDRATHKSDAESGGERSVSRQDETFLSRVPGRGAPSETSPMPAVAAMPDRVPAAAGRGPRDAAAGGPPPLIAVAGGDAAVPSTPFAGEATPAAAVPPAFAVSSTPAQSGPRDPGGAVGRPGHAPTTRDTAPALVIGRIDVVVVARDPQPAAPASSASRSDTGFLSRNYLKRL